MAASEVGLGGVPLSLFRASLVNVMDVPVSVEPDTDHVPVQLFRYIQGVDRDKIHILNQEEGDRFLQDPFARLILKEGLSPLSANLLLAALDATKGQPGGLKDRSVFHIAEGGQIPTSSATEGLKRSFRLAIAIDTSDIPNAIFISTGKALDATSERDNFLQLMGWDSTNKVFNFYQRVHRKWVWAGGSDDALRPNTRGRGPFSGHVNGGPVMKELRAPWSHWKSESSGPMVEDLFSRDDPFIKTKLFINKSDGGDVEGGERFERRIIPSIERWNKSRMTKEISNQQIVEPEWIFRQILDTTNVNLFSSLSRGAPHLPEDVKQVVLPSAFFYNSEFFDLLFEDFEFSATFEVSREIYLNAIDHFKYQLSTGRLSLPGDTFFAFLVPAVAFEDVDLLRQLIKQEAISPRLAASLLMVDFTNPIYSKRRPQLLQYIPKSIVVGEQGKDLDVKFVSQLLASGKHLQEGTVEKEFFGRWSIPEESWMSTFVGEIETYFKETNEKMTTFEGFAEVVRLAEARKKQFKSTPMSEFDLTLSQATANLD